MRSPEIKITNIIQTILDILFPLECVACRKKGEALCLQCLAKIEEPETPRENYLFAAAGYHDPTIKTAIQRLKYDNFKPVAEQLAQLVYKRIFEKELLMVLGAKPIVIIPVPIHKKRLRERGFNQSELIADFLLKIILAKNPVWQEKISLETKILLKNKYTESQVAIGNRKERLENMFDTMKVPEETKVLGKDIILIDDVSTTGATLNEARRVLRKTGGKRIYSVVVAR